MTLPRDALAPARCASQRVSASLEEGAQFVAENVGGDDLAGIRRKRKKVLSLTPTH